MKLSIVIVNHNHPELLNTCIESIVASHISFSYEIIIVDNASEKLPKIQSASWRTKIQIIKNDENLGFGRANNQGVKIAQGEYVLFLNTDIEVFDNAIEKLVGFASIQTDQVIVGGKLFNPDKTPQASCGPFYSLLVTFVMLFLQGDRLRITRFSPDKIIETDWVSGACLLMEKKDFETVGGFDESIFMYMDEVDLCYRAKKENTHVLFFPDAHFIHIGAATSKSLTDPIINIYRGLLYYYKKHGNTLEYILVKCMLLTKACIALVAGVVTNNKYLTTTYRKAISLL